jgi:hypothetical protein
MSESTVSPTPAAFAVVGVMALHAMVPNVVASEPLNVTLPAGLTKVTV